MNKISSNLKSGFRACGIVPCDVQPLLKRIPTDIQPADPISPGDSFLKHLEAKRAEWTEKKKTGKRRKMNVPPGKSVTAEDVQVGRPSTSTNPNRTNRALLLVNDDEEEGLNEDFLPQDESEDDFSAMAEQLEQEEREDDAFEKMMTNENLILLAPIEKEVGKFCVVKYMGQLYPGKIVSYDEDTAEVSSMQKSLKSWKWPAEPDILDYTWKNVLGKIEPPKLISKRGFYRVPELDQFNIQ